MIKPKVKNAKILCFSNHKGGVGKTVSACNIGVGLSLKNKKTLLIDLDPQGNLSLGLGFKDPEKTIYHVLRNEISAQEGIYNLSENLGLLPSTLDLAGAELELASETGREVILKKVLSDIEESYDYIIIDCAPSFGLLTTNALAAADEVFIPIQAEFFALKGITILIEVIKKIQRRINKSLQVGGVFITLYDARKSLHKDISQAVEKHFLKETFSTKIRNNVALAEANVKGVDIFRYAPKSYGASDYRALCDEILKRHT
ncbi:MAG: ParA family protein [Parachlamydiaceae bacterium]